MRLIPTGDTSGGLLDGAAAVRAAAVRARPELLDSYGRLPRRAEQEGGRVSERSEESGPDKPGPDVPGPDSPDTAELGATVAALTADDIAPARRRQLLTRLVGQARARGSPTCSSPVPRCAG